MTTENKQVALVSTDRQTVIEAFITSGLLLALNTYALREGKWKKASLNDLLIIPLTLVSPRAQSEINERWADPQRWTLWGDQPWQGSVVLAGLSTLMSAALPDELSGPFWYHFTSVAATNAVARLVGKRLFETEHTVYSRWSSLSEE